MNEKKIVLDPKKEVKVGVVILNVDEVIKNEIKKFDEAVTEDKLVAAVEGYRGLKIMGIDDKDGYDAVHQARIVLKNMRVEVDKRRKELKADFLKVGNAIEAQAKHLIGILEPTEKYLAEQEKVVDDEVERLKKEAKEKAEKERRDRIEGRIARLRDVGFVWSPVESGFVGNPLSAIVIRTEDIETWADEEFETTWFHEKAKYNEWLLAEEKRKIEEARVKAEQEALRKAESERLAKERAELEVLAKARKLEEERLAAKQAELNRLSEKLAENHRKLSSVHSGKVEFNYSISGITESIKTNLSKAQCVTRTNDTEFNKIIENVNVLIEKTLTYFDKEVEKWQANQKSTKQTK